jgi:hypothetical protein
VGRKCYSHRKAGKDRGALRIKGGNGPEWTDVVRTRLGMVLMRDMARVAGVIALVVDYVVR